MKTILIIALLLLAWPLAADRAICQETIRATTDTGKEVVLHADGTWKYVTAVPPKPAGLGLRKPGLQRSYSNRIARLLGSGTTKPNGS